jgi:hypothetical protein
MPLFKDLSGKTFGRLKAIIKSENRNNKVHWECICECGNKAIVSSWKLSSGHTKSCGCLQKEMASKANFKHGHSSYPNGGNPTKEYNTWAMMLRRCSPKAYKTERKSYFEKGITVCDRWKNSFENFLFDMGKAPTQKHSIDRINNNGNYEPENCRWATKKEQTRNRSTTSFIFANGERKSIGEWANITGIPYKRIHARLQRGWSADRAVNTAIK